MNISCSSGHDEIVFEDKTEKCPLCEKMDELDRCLGTLADTKDAEIASLSRTINDKDAEIAELKQALVKAIQSF